MFENQKRCPRCDGHLKYWSDLTDEERFLAERLPASAEFTPREREKHLFCSRCRYETNAHQPQST